MKKIVSILVLMFSLVVFSSPAFAGGEADIPCWRYKWTTSTKKTMNFTVTNRSYKDVDVTLSLRDEDGDPVTLEIVRIGDDTNNYYSAANATTTVPARGLRVFHLFDITQSSTIRGCGTISWEFSDESEGDTCRPLAVVVKEREVTSSGKYRASYQLIVNGDSWF